MNKFFPSSCCESLRKCVFLHTTEPIRGREARGRRCDDGGRRRAQSSSTSGPIKWSGRSTTLCNGERAATAPESRWHLSAPPALTPACAHTARHHYHLIVVCGCAVTHPPSSITCSPRLDHTIERTEGRLLAARRARSRPTLHDIEVGTMPDEYDLFPHASFDGVRCNHRHGITRTPITSPGLICHRLSRSLASPAVLRQPLRRPNPLLTRFC